MATFLAWWFLGSIIALAYGGRKLWEAIQELKRVQSLCKYAFEDRDTTLEYARGLVIERDAAIAERDDLIIKIQERASLPPAAEPPKHRRIRAGYATIRKAVEVNNRHEAELEEAREQNTAFVE